MVIGLPILPAHAGNLGSAYPYNLLLSTGPYLHYITHAFK